MISLVRPKATGVLAVLVAMTLAACDANESPGGKSSALVSYKRSGGLVGLTRTLTVGRRGRVVAAPAGKTFKLTGRQLRSLKRDIEDADLASLPADSRPDEPVPDGYQHTVTADGHTVYAEEGAVPARLEPLLGRLNGLLARGGLP